MVSDLYKLVSFSELGDIGNGDSYDARISANSTLVSFYSKAENLVDNDFAAGRNFFVKNLITGEVKILDVDQDGHTFREAQLSSFVFSPDNKQVVFSSSQQGLTPESGDTDVVYLLDLEVGVPVIISRNSAGIIGHGYHFGPQFIQDPSVNKIAFMGFISGLAPHDAHGPNSNSSQDIFIKDLDTGELKLVSTSESGIIGNNSLEGTPVFSYSGNKLLFYSLATDLIDGETTSSGNVFLKNVITGSVEVIDDVPVVVRSPVATFSKDDNFLKIGDEVLNLLTKDISSLSDAGLTETDFNYNPPQNTDYEVIVTNHSLLPEDTNHFFDVYLKDLNSGIVNCTPSAQVGQMMVYC